MAYTPTLLILKTDLELKRSVIKDNVHFVPAFLEGMAIRNAWAELDQALDAVPVVFKDLSITIITPATTEHNKRVRQILHDQGIYFTASY